MASIENDLQDFAEFARNHVDGNEHPPTIDELFDQWRLENPPSDDILAIKASLRDVDGGEGGKPVGDHIDEMRKKHNLS